jgi:hypothetical protein
MLARQVGGAGAGPAGTMIAVALPFIIRRMGPAGMVAMALGAWAINRILKEQAERDAAAGGTIIDVKAR